MSALRALKFLQTVKASPSLASLREMYSNQMGYRQMGLRLDDLTPVENPMVQEALRRLTPQQYQERTFRIRRAFGLSLKKITLEDGEWDAKDVPRFLNQDVPYLKPLLRKVEEELETTMHYDDLTMAQIPPELIARNKSS